MTGNYDGVVLSIAQHSLLRVICLLPSTDDEPKQEAAGRKVKHVEVGEQVIKRTARKQDRNQ